MVDLFGADVDDTANRSENAKSYATLTRTEFERNYLALHDDLPLVVQGLSTEVVEHVPAGSARFVHVDASHLYAQVAADIEAVKTVMQPDGVVVFDDIRAEHTPGVTAAVWEAASRGMVPFAITPYKLYATWGDPAKHLDTVRSAVTAHDRLTSSEQQTHEPHRDPPQGQAERPGRTQTNRARRRRAPDRRGRPGQAGRARGPAGDPRDRLSLGTPRQVAQVRSALRSMASTIWPSIVGDLEVLRREHPRDAVPRAGRRRPGRG